MRTFSFHFSSRFYLYRGTSGIDIDLRRVDIDQCPQRQVPGGVALPLNIFAGTDKCKQRTTEVIHLMIFFFLVTLYFLFTSFLSHSHFYSTYFVIWYLC